MGIRRWVYERLSQGQVDELDPNEPVPIAVVMEAEGPMLLSALQTTGLDAVGVPFAPTTFAGFGSFAHRRIQVLVPRREVEAAEQVLHDLRDDSPGTYIDWVLDRRTAEPGVVLSTDAEDDPNGTPH